MRLTPGVSLWPTARLSILNPRRRNRLTARLSTPGRSCNNVTNVCFTPCLLGGRPARSPWLYRQRLGCLGQHLADALVLRHHRKDVDLALDPEVDDDRAVVVAGPLDRGRHKI